MSIEGYSKTGVSLTPAPYVEATVYLPRLQVSNRVDFLIDTGADRTCIHPVDMEKLNIDYRRLRRNNLITGSGIGGGLDYYCEEAILVLIDRCGEERYCHFDILLGGRTGSPTIMDLPSLLGRDFINLCYLQADRSKNRLVLDPLNLVAGWVLPPELNF